MILSGVVIAADHGSTASSTSLVAGATGAGIDLSGMDRGVKPQQDFYEFANGKWLARTPIPPDKSSYTTLGELSDRALDQLHGIAEDVARPDAAAAGTERRKIGDLYASFMDVPAIDAAGLKPLQPELARIAALHRKEDLPALIAHLVAINVTAPYDLGVGPDARDSTRYAVGLDQGGLGLPDRDYYLSGDDARLSKVLHEYEAHIGRMLALSGTPRDAATQQAHAIVQLETELAKVQWTKVQLRDPVATYNKVPLAQLDSLTAGYDWNRFLASAELAGKIDYVVVGEPSYFKALGPLLEHTPLATWQSYFRFHLLSDFAPFLSSAFVNENFAFYGTVLGGTPENEARWKRGVHLLQAAIGEGLGRLYVEKYFPPENKARMQALVEHLITAYRQDIRTLDWMGPSTKQEAEAKLDRLERKIGYPNKWRDYGKLEIVRGDLMGNVLRAWEFEYRRQIGKLGHPIDREEWEMTPQTVNAYYRPDLNEIVFPAAILQPPMFDLRADDAANYGAIGAVIGHEISHAFDDQGSQFDSKGNLRDWWTPQDHERFAARTAALVAQYDAAEPLPGYHVNGKLTLGENIADNSGLAIAYKAYRLALGGRDAPVLDGFSGDQRFYLAFSQVWRGKMREPALIRLLKSNPHAPPTVRGSFPLRNQPAFYGAYHVQPGDKMYLPPAQRVIIW